MSAISITTFFKREHKTYDKTEIKSDFGDMKPLNVNEASFIQENLQVSRAFSSQAKEEKSTKCTEGLKVK